MRLLNLKRGRGTRDLRSFDSTFNCIAMKTKPFFSVIIPVHNKLPHLDRSINSVLNQSYINFELLLVDDASTDGSEKEILKYEDPRIRLFKRNEPGPGGYAARNLGIKMARYEWVCFLDADDEWDINLLETIKHTIEKHHAVDCVTWGWSSAMENRKWMDKTSLKNRKHSFRYFSLTDFFNQRHTLWTGAVAFRKSLILGAGAFPERGYKRGGDVDTWIRCLWQSRGNIWINKNLATYYLDSVNMVTKQVKMDPSYVFTPIVMDLKRSSDKKLVSAIKNYQNERIFSTVRSQIIAGEAVDYALIRKMNVSSQCVLLTGRLLYNKLRYGVKNWRSLSLRRERLHTDIANQFLQPLYDFDE
jgi:glycosyltransferase involved in cell wall biosynthesis